MWKYFLMRLFNRLNAHVCIVGLTQMIKKIRNVTIVTKLIASFSLIILIFLLEVIFSALGAAEIARLNNRTIIL